ncbi:MAG: FAD-dependent oxidoreductase [Thaumarchaeota archaeon]|nr:FAD-dependent oxidoreductase [Nitrososphaerota archaeon]|tara:strand:+ start:520 stop:2085 length:1566 start_codon:yes stop_codon:yes gene_type:complete
MSTRFDALVIGAGHNGLTCAGYLAKAGLRVLVLERRNIIGGACTTEELLRDEAPGFKFNVCASDHIFIHLTPVLRDLRLAEFGLEYINIDPIFFLPFPDKKHIFIHKSVDETIRSIETVSKHDARAYANLVQTWSNRFEQIIPNFLEPPRSLSSILTESNEGDETLRLLSTSLSQILNETFETDYVKVPIALFAAQGGNPPDELGTGLFSGLFTLLHQSGMKRPRGGSGALITALARSLEAFGGQILTDVNVEKILITNGHVGGVQLVDGRRIESNIVVSSADPKRTFLSLLKDYDLDSNFRKHVESLRVRSYKLKLDCALKELPNYQALPGLEPGLQHRASQLICPSLDYLERAYHESQFTGKLSSQPAIWGATHSAADTSLAPNGSHVLYAMALFCSSNESRKADEDAVRREGKEKIIDTLTEYAPNLRGAILADNVMTNEDFETRLGLPRGNSMHIDATLDQMFSLRPVPGWSDYRTPVPGLYITGAGTHPSGGITAAPGHNSAQIVLKDWQMVKNQS